MENSTKTPEPTLIIPLQSLKRQQTYLLKEKENLLVSKNNLLGRDTSLTSPKHSFKRPDKKKKKQI